MCLEFSEPQTPVVKDVYRFCLNNFVGQIHQVFHKNQDTAKYFVESIRKFPKQEEWKGRMEKAGFKIVTYTNLSGGLVAVHSGFKI